MKTSNTYHFITQWKMQATCEEVYAIISNSKTLAKWWPSVYLDVKEIEAGGENNIGKKIALFTKGFLPYTLRWQFVISENRKPYHIKLVAEGDFVGRGIWTFEQAGEDCFITFDWELSAEKPVLKYLSFIMKPIFSANHIWAMKKGEESLRLELLRQRAKSDEERAAIPIPPPPTFPHNWMNNKVFS